MVSKAPSPESAHSAALRALCEIVYRPTDQRRDELLAYNWTALPRIHNALRALPEPVSPAAIADMAWTLVQEAVTELETSFPARPDAITPLEVVRLHILERLPWPSIEAMLREEGRAHSRGTLIRRQHEFMPYLETWAGEGAVARRRSGMGIGVGLASLAVGVAVFLWLRGSDPPRYEEPGAYRYVSNRLYTAEQWPELAESLDLELRSWSTPGFEPRGVTLFPPDQDHGPLAFGIARRDSPTPGQVALWDPVSGEVLWVTEFKPTREQAKTHATLPEVALDDPFVGTVPVHSHEIPDRIALPYTNRFSACFVVQFDLATGEILSTYTHPGRLQPGVVIDLDGDGRSEFVFGGQDNVTNRPVLVALAPTDHDGQASNVMWRDPPGREDAIARALLPPVRSLEAALHAERLAVVYLDHEAWNPVTRILSFGVRAHGEHLVYMGFADSALTLTGVVHGEPGESVWRNAGLTPTPVDSLLADSWTLRSSDAEPHARND